jgi:hypothetical protein
MSGTVIGLSSLVIMGLPALLTGTAFGYVDKKTRATSLRRPAFPSVDSKLPYRSRLDTYWPARQDSGFRKITSIEGTGRGFDSNRRLLERMIDDGSWRNSGNAGRGRSENRREGRHSFYSLRQNIEACNKAVKKDVGLAWKLCRKDIDFFDGWRFG